MSRIAGPSRPVRLVAPPAAADSCASESTFAERLSQLWLRRPGLTSAAVSTALATRGGPTVSVWTLDRLRLGTATNPTMAQVEALAAFFEVAPVSLLGAAAERRFEADLQRVGAVRTTQARDLLVRIGDLSPDGVAAVRHMVECCAALDGRTG